jgi:hypothetical protein
MNFLACGYAQATFNYICAQGWSQKFAQHKVHDQMTVSFMEPTGATCVCTTGLTGELCKFYCFKSPVV